MAHQWACILVSRFFSYFFPWSWLRRLCRHAARVMAPPPSTTIPSLSWSIRIPSLMCFSFTTSICSFSKLFVYRRTISKEFSPTWKFREYQGKLSSPFQAMIYGTKKIANVLTLGSKMYTMKLGRTLTLATFRPSARVAGFECTNTGSPLLMASVKLGHHSDSTACRELYSHVSWFLSLQNKSSFFD